MSGKLTRCIVCGKIMKQSVNQKRLYCSQRCKYDAHNQNAKKRREIKKNTYHPQCHSLDDTMKELDAYNREHDYISYGQWIAGKRGK